MFAAAAVAAAGCESGIEERPRPMPEVNESEVEFAMPADATRTALEGDGKTTRWVVGDKIALWAQDNASGEYVAEGVQFMLRHFSPTYTHAFFAGNIAAQNEESEYTYYMCSPMPKSSVGTSVTYTLPAEQNGIYEGVRNGETYTTYDIMVSEPVVSGALTTGQQMELNTKFLHQMHALKITVPEGRNLFKENGSSKFYELEISFPAGCTVAGDITFDVANPDATPTYSNTSNVIRVTSNEGFDAGSEIWVFVLPGSVNGDIAYHVRGVRRRSEFANNALSKQLERGHVTPIKMRIPEIYPLYTAVHFSIDQNHLGEEFNKFDVYDANNNHMGTFERNASNKYSVDYEGEFDADQYDNTNWRIVFDSEHAIVETVVNLGDMTDYTEHSRWMNVPYLFSENFSTIQSYSRDVVTNAQGTTVTAYDLSQSTYGLSSGWTGARTGGEAGKSIRVGSRVDRVWGYTHTYGRLDSPTISALKEDATVNVTVSFNYSGGRDGDSGYSPKAVCGYTQTSGLIDGSSGSFSSDEDKWNNIDGYNLIPSISTSGSYSNITQTMTYTIANCSNSHRLSWQIRATGEGGLISNGNQWMFIDNVRVQIIP